MSCKYIALNTLLKYDTALRLSTPQTAELNKVFTAIIPFRSKIITNQKFLATKTGPWHPVEIAENLPGISVGCPVTCSTPMQMNSGGLSSLGFGRESRVEGRMSTVE